MPPKGKPEPGAKPVVQRQGQGPVLRSGMPQPERTVLPMATNTGKGEVLKHELPPPATTRRLTGMPSISELRPDQGFSRIKMSDTPTPAPRTQQPARYIQLPQQRPAAQAPGPAVPAPVLAGQAAGPEDQDAQVVPAAQAWVPVRRPRPARHGSSRHGPRPGPH